MSDEKRGRGRPPKPTSQPAPRLADEKPPLEERAQKNVFSVFKLIGRAIGSEESLDEDEFEDAGHGIKGLQLLFPKYAKEIEESIDLLAPAATVVDLTEKLGRLFSRSKLKKTVEERTEALRHRGEQQSGT